MKRPTGVTVIAILGAIGGVLSIVGGFGLMSLSGSINSMMGAVGVSYPLFSVSVWGIILVALGILDLVAVYGAWNLKKWSWNLLVGLMVFGIIQNLLFISVSGAGAVFGIVIEAVVLYYLFQVKDAFSQS